MVTEPKFKDKGHDPRFLMGGLSETLSTGLKNMLLFLE